MKRRPLYIVFGYRRGALAGIGMAETPIAWLLDPAKVAEQWCKRHGVVRMFCSASESAAREFHRGAVDRETERQQKRLRKAA